MSGGPPYPDAPPPWQPPPPPPPPPPVVYYQYAPPRPTSTNGFAIAALVLGILWLYWVGSILALVFGHVARAQIDRSGGAQGGGGLALAGIVLGWVGIGFLGLLLALGVSLSLVFGTD